MSAHPIIPGKLYCVRHAGRVFAVRAGHGCEAIITIVDMRFNPRP